MYLMWRFRKAFSEEETTSMKIGGIISKETSSSQILMIIVKMTMETSLLCLLGLTSLLCCSTHQEDQQLYSKLSG
ncbi:hypothetical protein ATANTOWER_016262 [Ataeniobius toweri]|uniref:Uncharacterized protein n=1 Tax=Ataeniobius toweri TaxID=208326 RepID=A0ABU7C7X7_9TELE|nr:hypothetical protein [Ataeniobius toweri]